jgi:hypothetical protein
MPTAITTFFQSFISFIFSHILVIALTPNPIIKSLLIIYFQTLNTFRKERIRKEPEIIRVENKIVIFYSSSFETNVLSLLFNPLK